MKPCDCESLSDLLSMDATHKNVGDFDMMLQHDQAVIFTKQKSGQSCESQITIPKRIFNQMLGWYEKDQSEDSLKNAQNIRDAWRDGLGANQNSRKTCCSNCGGEFKRNKYGRFCPECKKASNRRTAKNRLAAISATKKDEE